MSLNPVNTKHHSSYGSRDQLVDRAHQLKEDSNSGRIHPLQIPVEAEKLIKECEKVAEVNVNLALLGLDALFAINERQVQLRVLNSIVLCLDRHVAPYNLDEVLRLIPSKSRLLVSLFHTHYSNRGYFDAIKYHQASKALNMSECLESDAAVCLRVGNAYYLAGVEEEEAMRVLERAITLADKDTTEGKDLLFQAYGILGSIQQRLSQKPRARVSFERAWTYATKAKDKRKLASILADCYLHEWRDTQDKALWDKGNEYLEIVVRYFEREKIDSKEKVIEYGRLANCLVYKVQYEEAAQCFNAIIQYYQDHPSDEENDQDVLATAFNCLGTCLTFLQKYSAAIEAFLEARKIFIASNNLAGLEACLNNLGLVYSKMSEHILAIGLLAQSVDLSKKRDRTIVSSEAKITLFQDSAKAYLQLEEAFILSDEPMKALEVSDGRRARTLSSLLLKRLSNNEDRLLPDLTHQKMQSLAKKLKTTFFVYSLSFLDVNKNIVSAWIIPPVGDIFYKQLPYEDLEEGMDGETHQQFPYTTPPAPSRPVLIMRGEEDAHLNHISSFFPPTFLTEIEGLNRGSEGNPLALESFKKKLAKWYKLLIYPIEVHLPLDPSQTVTIIPDGLFSHIPFAAFRDESGKYLIEKHPVLIAPSIRVLHLLDQLPKKFSSKAAVVGNPTTLHASALEKSETEASIIVATLLDLPKEKVLIQKTPTVPRVLEEMSQARWIHLACHGETGEKAEEKPDPHSVFEGFFKLVPDEVHTKGYLYAQEIATRSLNAELVFLSACFSGRGKLQREGSIGPIWSFLAAGALSTVATYWKLPDSQLTLDMVKTFYSHALGKDVEKLNKARALQQAMLKAIGTERENPHKWAAFFLSGVDVETKPQGESMK